MSKNSSGLPSIKWLDFVQLSNNRFTLGMFISKLLSEIEKDELQHRAAAVAFSFTLSVFPGILFLFSVIPYVPIPELDIQIMMFLSKVIPHGIYHEVAGTINDIVSKPRSGVLSIGFFLTLYSTTSGVTELVNTFNRCQGTPDKRGFIRKKSRALLLTVLLSFSLLFTILVIIVGEQVLSFLSEIHWFRSIFYAYLLQAFRIVAVLLVFYTSIYLTYRFGPGVRVRGKSNKFLNSGAFWASLLTIVLTQGFSYYISNFSSYNRLYGSIGTFIALMLWLYLICFILLLGFEINSCLHELKEQTEPKLKPHK